jgi:hypothetical protein
MDEYLTSLNEVEARLEASERWIDIPIKDQDYAGLNLDITNEDDPAEYYRTMFDLIGLAFDADITRSVTFMLNREDGMGISNTFPLKLGLSKPHHNLSHATDKEGQLDFAKFDLFLSQQISYFVKKLDGYRDRQASVLDNTIVLFGSGASTTHNSRNLPTMIIGGAAMGLQHGQYWREDDARLSNVYLSILRSMDIETDSFSDSTEAIANPIFTRA